MAHYKMKYFGSCQGKISGMVRHFSKGQIIEAQKGEFGEADAEDVSADFKEPEKKTKKVKAGTSEAETASIDNQSEKR